MSSHEKPKYKISAKNIGPIFELDATLTEHAQNLIFARNGVGKSFLSRAFRQLDLHQQNKSTSDPTRDLVSEEAVDGKGNIEFLCGDQTLGKLLLGRQNGDSHATVSDEIIFHVFSEDYISTELREREYRIDGEIKNEIVIDSDNIKRKDAIKDVEDAEKSHDTERNKLADLLSAEKLNKLSKKLSINKQLKNYKEVDLSELLARYDKKPTELRSSLNELTRELDKLKSIPSDPTFPGFVDAPAID